jgi:hypothetical protein
MIGLFCFVLTVLASPFKSKLRLDAENAVLRHQLIVLKRRLRGRVRLTNKDRWFFIQLYRWFPSILKVSHNHPARDARALAQGRLSLLLALEVAPIGRATADRHGAPRISSIPPDVLKRAAPECRFVVIDDQKRVTLAGAAPLGESSSFQFDFKDRLPVGRYTMFAVITLNGNVMNADIRHIPIVVSSDLKRQGSRSK